MKRTLFVLLFIGLAVTLLSLGLYFIEFGIPSNFSLSKRQTDWAEFGTFVGGVLGPIYALLAFGGVYLTVQLQAEQIRQSARQSHLDELQRMVSTIAGRIDTILDQELRRIPPELEQHLKESTVFAAVSAGGTAALNRPEINEINQRVISTVKGLVRYEADRLCIEFDQLVWCLQQYMSADGHQTIEEYYRRRFGPIICWMELLGFLTASPRTIEYFRPQELREFLKP